ncbi:MAG: hypothetical protein H0T45_18100 [Pyrinomonadaceae bacterium]|nr:hypothetical protein [Pyrinomonadaceae bacterium]
MLAHALGVDFNFQLSASVVFKELAERVPAYAGLRYPALKDESKPAQAKHAIAARRDLSAHLDELRQRVEAFDESREKLTRTPPVGHELFKPGTLTGKTPQFPLLYAGNPKPPTVLISPLYQISVDSTLRRATVMVAAGD